MSDLRELMPFGATFKPETIQPGGNWNCCAMMSGVAIQIRELVNKEATHLLADEEKKEAAEDFAGGFT